MIRAINAKIKKVLKKPTCLPAPTTAPVTEPAKHIAANLNAFFVEPKTSAIKRASGGIGKKDASANAKMNKAAGPYGVLAQWRTQSYNLRMNFI